MKYLAKDLEDVAKMLERRAESSEQFSAAFKKTNKTAAGHHEAQAIAFREAAGLVRDVEIRP